MYVTFPVFLLSIYTLFFCSVCISFHFRDVLRICVLASCVTLSSSFVLWPFYSLFQTKPTAVAPGYSFQSSPPTPVKSQQLPVYDVADCRPWCHLNGPASQNSKTSENSDTYTLRASDKRPLYEIISLYKSSASQAKTAQESGGATFRASDKRPLYETISLYNSGASHAKTAQESGKTTSKDKRCFHEGRYHEPLTEISNGRSGDWCYGTYCNHEGKIVHWDDLNCPLTITPTPAPTKPPQPSNAGCIYYGVWYAAGADIDNYVMDGKCHGTYCDWTSHIVHWEDSCYATVPTIATPKPDIYKKKWAVPRYLREVIL